MEHQVATAYEFDDEEKTRSCLEARVQTDQEWMIGRRLKDVLFSLNPVDILKKKKLLFLLFIQLSEFLITSSSVTSSFLITFMA